MSEISYDKIIIGIYLSYQAIPEKCHSFVCWCCYLCCALVTNTNGNQGRSKLFQGGVAIPHVVSSTCELGLADTYLLKLDEL